MNETDIVLLKNVFDSLDRLFDRELGVIDLYFLMFATQEALSEPRWVDVIRECVGKLDGIVRSIASAEDQGVRALIETDELRISLNDMS